MVAVKIESRKKEWVQHFFVEDVLFGYLEVHNYLVLEVAERVSFHDKFSFVYILWNTFFSPHWLL